MTLTDKQVTRTEDLGHNWFVNFYSDGSLTLRNSEKGQRIDLRAQSVELLRKIIRENEPV